jgi:hypothetical protein
MVVMTFLRKLLSAFLIRKSFWLLLTLLLLEDTPLSTGEWWFGDGHSVVMTWDNASLCLTACDECGTHFHYTWTLLDYLLRAGVWFNIARS